MHSTVNTYNFIENCNLLICPIKIINDRFLINQNSQCRTTSTVELIIANLSCYYYSLNVPKIGEITL